MQIDNEFRVQAPPGEVWDYLQRTEDVVECIPGAVILEKLSEDSYQGRVIVKLGPLTVVLEGLVTIEGRDHESHAMKLSGRAKDTKGRGATDARVAVDVVEDGQGAQVTLHSDIKITGKIAQFGRGVMKDVSQRIADEFARNLEARLTAPADLGEHGVVPADEATAGDPAASRSNRKASAAAPARGDHRNLAPSVGGLRLLGGALLRVLGSSVTHLLRRLTGAFGRDKSGHRQ